MRPILLSLLALAGLASSVQAQEIARFRADGAVPLLKGAILPAGAEIFYLSGQIAAPIDPAKPMAPTLTRADMGDTKVQTISALGKVKVLLEEHGYRMADIVKTTVFLVGDPAMGGEWDFAGMNEGFKAFFGTADNPNAAARSTVKVSQVAYPTFLVEIEVVAARVPAGEGKRR